MDKILKTYLRRLTNLSGNNRSLLLLRLIADQFLDVHQLNFINSEPSFNIISDLIAGKSKIKLGQQVDARDDDANKVSLKLKKLFRLDKFIFDERGGKDLYVGWPFVQGKLMDGTLIRGPILFFPVELELSKNHWYLNLRKDVNLTFNKSFLLAYAYYNKISLDEDLIERVFDDFDRDVKGFRNKLYKVLKDSPVEINFNQEIFLDSLQKFVDYKKDEFDDKEKTGELKLYPEAVLGIFPQSGSYLVPDYIHMIENGNYEEMEDFFAEHSFSDESEEEKKRLSFFYFLNKIKEEQTFTPFKMDAFQENALKAVKKGNSIVVQGPPGTGKSQLICNLASDFMARGKNVLIVCQKRAALDVVYDRLKEEHISDFVALVHDFKNDRKAIYQQINTQIENLYEYKLKNNSLDSIQLERNFLKSSRQIDAISEDLDELKHALFDESECGVSIKELYLTSDLSKPFINFKQEYNYFNFSNIEEFKTTIGYYITYAQKFLKEGYPWRLRKDFSLFQITDLKELINIIQSIPEFQKKLNNETTEIVNSGLSFLEGEAILLKENEINEMFEMVDDDETYMYFNHYLSTQPKGADHLYISNIEKNLLSCYEGDGIEACLKTKDLGSFQLALQKMFEARRNIYKWIRWQLFSKDRPLIDTVLSKNNLTRRRKDLKVLTRKLDNRLNLEHNLSKLKKNSWVINIPPHPGRETIKQWFTHNKKAIIAKDIFISIRGFSDFINPASISASEFENKTKKLLETLRGIPAKRLEWENYLMPSQIQEILADKYDLKRYVDILKADFSDLCDFDKIRNNFYDYEARVITKLDDILDKFSKDQVLEVFMNSFRLAWINHIETKYPILINVSTLKFEPTILELQNAIKEKLRISREIVLMKSRERTYEGVEYNRLNNMTTYRDLKHQVIKKRKIWPVRRLISNFSRELFNLIPCWLTSPEAASAIFPMEKMFDIVIFDEASQCFVERGLPAIYRGKQIVVAGDAKQLSPFDLYKTRYDLEDEEDPELEVDSLLDLSEKYLMQVQLKGHYRSQSIDLIDFSNKYFYNGNLTLLPDKKVINRKIPAIEFIKVDGIWEKNANIIEARKVIDILFKLMRTEPGKSIGIISFNVKQQDLLMDIVEERAIEENILLPSSLFIKNIENVQGDERDIIIFSLTHGPDTSGRLSMQFGSLNVKGGANRLNVAVTRAREKIVLVTSFHPQEMKTKNLVNEGPGMLQKYLEYAMKVSVGEHLPELKPPLNPSANWYLKSKLSESLSKEEKFNLEISEELPFADLTLKSIDEYKGIILTDDDLYFQSVSPKEVHAYNPFLFSSKNWKFRGVFSRELWNNEEEVIERLVRFSNQLSDE